MPKNKGEKKPEITMPKDAFELKYTESFKDLYTQGTKLFTDYKIKSEGNFPKSDEFWD